MLLELFEAEQFQGLMNPNTTVEPAAGTQLASVTVRRLVVD